LLVDRASVGQHPHLLAVSFRLWGIHFSLCHTGRKAREVECGYSLL
jgi:hypothetical protein